MISLCIIQETYRFRFFNSEVSEVRNGAGATSAHRYAMINVSFRAPGVA